MAKRSRIVSFEDAKKRSLGKGGSIKRSNRSGHDLGQSDPSIKSDVIFRDSISNPLDSNGSGKRRRSGDTDQLKYVFQIDFENDDPRSSLSGDQEDIFVSSEFDNPNLGISSDDIEEAVDEFENPEGRTSKVLNFFNRKKRERNKAKADKAFSRSLANSASQSDSGPRAALYKGEIGASQKRAAKLQQNTKSVSGVTFAVPSLKLPNVPKRIMTTICVLCCITLFIGMLYTPAQNYYRELRERDRLNAEYTALVERNNSLSQIVDNLQTDEGIEDKAHAEFGLVKPGEQAGAVVGIDVDDSMKFEANIPPGSIKAPDTWYSDFLDFFFVYND